ncbi:XK-related protein 6, partial [Stegodyphus mimosarum]
MKHLASRQRLLTFGQAEELEHSTGDHADRPSFSKMEEELLKGDEDAVGIFSAMLTTISLFSYSVDIASSAVLCYWLFNTGRWWWWLSIGSLLCALLIVNIFSMRWYIHDAQEDKAHVLKVSPSHWVMRALFHIVLLGPVIRYLELFLYGLHSCDRNDPKRHQYRLMFLQEDRDTSLLALVGSFVKSAPQLVLHTYILTQNKFPINLPTTRAQAVNLIAALIELSLSQSSYHRALRRSLPTKRNISKSGATVQFLSHLCVISSRVLSLAVFASLYEHWVFVFCAIHWGLMTTWLIFQRTSFCASASGQPRPLEELIFNIVIGVIYVFCFVNVKDEPTRWKYTIYYIIIWIENVTLVVLWYLRADPDLWFRIPLLSSVVSSLAAGLLLLIIYYQFLHPNKLVTPIPV